LASIGHHQSQVGSQECILGLPALPLLAAELQVFLLVLVVASRQTGAGVLTGFDSLGKLNFLLSREQVIFANRSQILRYEIGCQPAALVGQLALETLTPRLLRSAVAGRLGSRHWYLILQRAVGSPSSLGAIHYDTEPAFCEPPKK
jgi:hypothetical protein